jgi:hypothetical protein
MDRGILVISTEMDSNGPLFRSTELQPGTGALAISPGAPAAPTEGEYARHRPEEAVLYKLLAEHWRPFLAETQAEDRPLAVSLPVGLTT